MLNIKSLKYSEILKMNRESKSHASSSAVFNSVVLSNSIVHQLNDIVEFALHKSQINCSVTSGDYDNIVQDSSKFADSKMVIVFWELCNLIDGLQYKANLMTEPELNKLIEKTKTEIDFVFKNLSKTPLVIFNKFSSLIFNHLNLKENSFDIICDELNNYVAQKKTSNFFIADIDKVISRCGITNAIDMRYYFSSKALYSVEFFKTYCEYLLPVILSVNGKSKKALILDCDNTLWKGIIGEDGAEGIKLNGKTKEGIPFEYAQSIALGLSKNGVIIGINSKNNPEDVEAVLQNHSDQVLKNDRITIKRVNWQDKVSNLKEISSALNIGTDSFIMVDDSDFEVNFIRESLPVVSVLQVPEKNHDYPFALIAASQYFFNMSSTKEDTRKGEMYKEQTEREHEKILFGNVEDYLKSLELVLTISVNNTKNIERVAQLTQKTNQFNLTTKRYTEADISGFMSGNNHHVFDFSLADKFGDYGITGVCIVLVNELEKSAVVDTLLMSCRVIGRNVEIAFLNHIIAHLTSDGIELLFATFDKTIKNDQVKDFYVKLGFETTTYTDAKKDYQLLLKHFKETKTPYLKINKL